MVCGPPPRPKPCGAAARAPAICCSLRPPRQRGRRIQTPPRIGRTPPGRATRDGPQRRPSLDLHRLCLASTYQPLSTAYPSSARNPRTALPRRRRLRVAVHATARKSPPLRAALRQHRQRPRRGCHFPGLPMGPELRSLRIMTQMRQPVHVAYGGAHLFKSEPRANGPSPSAPDRICARSRDIS